MLWEHSGGKEWPSLVLYCELGDAWKSGFGYKEMSGIKIKNRTRGVTLETTVFPGVCTKWGSTAGENQKSWLGPDPEGTGYQAKEWTLDPRCRMGCGEVAERKMTLATDRLGRSWEWEASQRLLRWCRQEEMSTLACWDDVGKRKWAPWPRQNSTAARGRSVWEESGPGEWTDRKGRRKSEA